MGTRFRRNEHDHEKSLSTSSQVRVFESSTCSQFALNSRSLSPSTFEGCPRKLHSLGTQLAATSGSLALTNSARRPHSDLLALREAAVVVAAPLDRRTVTCVATALGAEVQLALVEEQLLGGDIRMGTLRLLSFALARPVATTSACTSCTCPGHTRKELATPTHIEHSCATCVERSLRTAGVVQCGGCVLWRARDSRGERRRERGRGARGATSGKRQAAHGTRQWGIKWQAHRHPRGPCRAPRLPSASSGPGR